MVHFHLSKTLNNNLLQLTYNVTHTHNVLILEYMTSFAQHPDPPFTVRSFHQFLSTVREME